MHSITLTSTCNRHPAKPYLLYEKKKKVGYAEINLTFSYSASNIDCSYLSEPSHHGSSNMHPHYIFIYILSINWVKLKNEYQINAICGAMKDSISFHMYMHIILMMNYTVPFSAHF